MIEILQFILSAILCFLISSAVHELGHVLMGLKEGFKFYLFIAGPFGFKRNENDKIVAYFEKDISLWGGIGGTTPQNEDGNNFKKFGRVLLAGPITSLIFGAIWLPMGIISDNLFLILLGAMPLSMGIACLIPARNGAFHTDGGRWLRMHRSEETRAVELAIWNLTQNSIVQGHFANANFEEIEILINDQDARTKYMGHYYAYRFYKDNNDRVKQENEIDVLSNLKEGVPKQLVSMFKID